MKKPNRYIFPAIFTYYDDGGDIAITFPDLPGCTSQSPPNEKKAMSMANEALSGHLLCMEEDDDEIPVPTPPDKVILLKQGEDEDGPGLLYQRVVLIKVYMPDIRRYFAEKEMCAAI